MTRNRLWPAGGTGSARLLASAALLAAFLIGCNTAPSGAPLSSTPDVETAGPGSPTPTSAATSAVATATPAADDTGVLFRDSFESLAAWDVSSYVFAPWTLDPSAGSENAPSAAFSPYLNDEEAKMGHVVQLPTTTPIVLRYSAWYETETDFDLLIVWVHSVGRDDWESLASHSGSSGGGFLDFTVDLSAYAGRDLEVVFGFRSDRRDAVSGGGARVDDVAVTVGR